MERVYRVSIFNKIFSIIGVVILLCFIVTVVAIAGNGLNGLIILLPMVFAIAGVLAIANTFTRKITITDTSISYIKLFKTKEILLKDITGVRIESKALKIETESDGKMLIAYMDFASSGEFTSWLREHFTDLNKVEADAATQQFLADEHLGTTTNERQEKLDSAKAVVVLYTMAGGFVALIGMVLSDRFPLTIFFILLIYPIIGMLYIHKSNGLLALIAKKNSGVLSMIAGIIVPIIVLMVIGLTNQHIFSLGNLWFPLIALTAVLFVVFYRLSLNKSQPMAGQLILLTVISIVYAFGTLINLDTDFDNAKPQEYDAQVLDHGIVHSKSTSYYLTLSPWGPMREIEREDVGQTMYNDKPIGSTVEVYFRKGLLNVPWYTIEEE